MKPLALAAALAVALTLCGAAQAVDGWDEVEPAAPVGCTFAELRVLEIELGFDGWVELNRSALAVAAHEKVRACSKVPAAWRAVNRSFKRSTELVDRLYPGKYHGSWADRCADSEGGHGLFVLNRQGSGAGGWLQFLSGTFWSVIYQGVARARAHGVRIPVYAMTWTSPLGQAIAGSEMLWRGRGGEWSGATC